MNEFDARNYRVKEKDGKYYYLVDANVCACRPDGVACCFYKADGDCAKHPTGLLCPPGNKIWREYESI